VRTDAITLDLASTAGAKKQEGKVSDMLEARRVELTLSRSLRPGFILPELLSSQKLDQHQKETCTDHLRQASPNLLDCPGASLESWDEVEDTARSDFFGCCCCWPDEDGRVSADDEWDESRSMACEYWDGSC
jgi:hypothetical protein